MTTIAPLFNDPTSASAEIQIVTALKDLGRRHLPEVMVPTRFVFLDRLPKLPNGKIDRKALPRTRPGEPAPAGRRAPSTPVEKEVAATWSEILGVGEVGLDDSFFDLGGDSISVVKMVAQVRQRFGVAVSIRDVFKVPTVAALARSVEGTSTRVVGGLQNLTDGELLLEAVLPDDIDGRLGAAPARRDGFDRILLTGGTGYTGAFLLRELLDRSEARVFVVVRAEDDEEAIARVLDNLALYAGAKPGDRGRIVGVPGDVGRPYLGLRHETYWRLCSDVEMIIHNAAISSYAMPYRQLHATNVLGTLEVLRLASRTRLKPVHYVSSLAVFPGKPGETVYAEEPLSVPDGLTGGYRQTKWVSDRLVSLASQRGIPCNVYRPGQITGAQTTGTCATDTYLNAAIKSCIELGTELDFDVVLENSPVDFCAKSIVRIALLGEHSGSIFHLTGSPPVHWRELVGMLRTFGYRIDRAPYTVWYERLADVLERGGSNALAKFFPLFGADAPSKDAGDEGSRPIYRNDNLRRALQGSGIACEALDQALVDRYLRYFISIGYLPHPDPDGAEPAEGAHA